MRVFLTGVTGFIGAHIARTLLAHGCDVYVLVRLNSDMWRIADLLPKLHIVQGDLAAVSDAMLREIQPQMCIHAAWYAVPGRYLTAPENVDILRESLHLAQALARVGCRRFVGLGTCFEYDFSYGYLAESTPTKPQTIYAATKSALYTTLMQMDGLDVAWGRLFYQHGAYEDERRLVPAVITKLLRNTPVETTDGTQIRDFLHVEDVAAAVWAVAQSKLTGAVNIGAGVPISVRQIVETLGRLAGREELLRIGALPQRAGDPPFICANNARLQAIWQPHYTLESGLQQTIEWWKEQLKVESEK